jgi:hypothetical protein
MVTGARDPESGLANLDVAIAQRLASQPDDVTESLFSYSELHLGFRFLDRVFERISELGSRFSDYLFVCGTIDRRSGFTADPEYLELAKKYGLTKIWDRRGPPDHCKKIDSQWICE